MFSLLHFCYIPLCKPKYQPAFITEPRFFVDRSHMFSRATKVLQKSMESFCRNQLLYGIYYKNDCIFYYGKLCYTSFISVKLMINLLYILYIYIIQREIYRDIQIYIVYLYTFFFFLESRLWNQHITGFRPLLQQNGICETLSILWETQKLLRRP